MAEQSKARANSRLEQKMDELYYLIESARPSTFSKSKVLIDREVAFEILHDMREMLPEELKKYREMTTQYGSIIGEAQLKANDIEKKAKDEQAKLINEHEIVEGAYAKADSMVKNARKQGDELLMSANQEADLIKEGAFEYTQTMMQNLQQLLSSSYQLMDEAFRPFMEGVERKLTEVDTALQGLEEPVEYDEAPQLPEKEETAGEEYGEEDYEDEYEN